MIEGINELVQLQITGLKNGNSFTDRKYVDNCRFVIDGDDTIIYTSEYKNIKTKQLIATHQFLKGTLTLHLSENIRIEEIKTANDILLINNDGCYYQCNLIDYTLENVNNTLFSTATLDLMILKKYLTSGANKDDIVNNNVIRDYSSSDYCLKNLGFPIYFELSNYEHVPEFYNPSDLISGIKFYTQFYPKLKQSDNLILNKDVLNAGDEVVNKVISFNTATIRLILSEIQYYQLKKYIDFCHYRNNETKENFGNQIVHYHTAVYKGIKPATFEYKGKIELENIGLYEVDVTVYYERFKYSPQMNKLQ
jgi:tRNA A-37 threonylcarbamoyl transferase component Bud32